MEWRSVWNRGGKIDQVCWIDRDVIVWPSGGSHLIFLHVRKKLQTLWRCPESMDGASSISSYPQLHLIALSEGCPNPRILIFTYPSMKIISECKGGTENGYLTTAFAPPDFLVSLASFPSYNLILWNWRSGSQLCFIATPIHDLRGQVIKVFQGKPASIAQLGRDSGKLLIWQIVRNSISPLVEEVTLPKRALPVDIDWSPDASDPFLAIADDSGHVYLCKKNWDEPKRIVFSQRCATCLDYEVPVLSWFTDGILLKTTFCQMRFYRKGDDTWRRQWYIKTLLKPHILSADIFKKDRLIFFAGQGDVMEMTLAVGETSPKIDKIFDYGSGFKFLEVIYPWGHHVAAVDHLKNLVIMASHSGEEIGRLELSVEGDIVNIISHLECPMILVSTSAGEICSVSLHDYQNPRVLSKYQFEKHQMDLLKFSQCGRYLITGRKKYGLFYCIESVESPSSTVRKIETEHRVLDIAMFNRKGELMLLMLILPFKRAKVANCIIIYKLPPFEKIVGAIVSVLKLPTLYDNFHYGLEPMTMVASPFSSRNLHTYKIQNDQICLTNAAQSPHKIRGMKVHTDRNWIITYGFDGIIGVVKNFKNLEWLAHVNSHHRLNFGVSKAVLKPEGDFVFSLGSDGSLLGLKLMKIEKNQLESPVDFGKTQIDYAEVKKNISKDYSRLNPDIIQMLSRRYEKIPPEDSGVEIWSDWMIRQQAMREEEQSKDLKSSIMNDFYKLKIQVSKLLDENEKLPVQERLAISAFDLDMIEREQKIKTAKEEREDRRLELEFQCTQVEKVSNWIKKTFWDVQDVKQQSIFAIFGDTEVMNFASLPCDPQEKEIARWLESFSEINDNLRGVDREPRAYTLLRDRYSPVIEDERTIVESFLEDEDEIAKKDKIEEVQAAAGVTTFRYVEPSSEYCQFKHYTFPQLHQFTTSLITDSQTLKHYFNKLFNETFTLKERAMSSASQIISQIRFIDSELRLMFGSSVPEIPVEPHWSPEEKPESIVIARDDEVPVKPYVSPSEQDLLDKQAVDQERLRLLMLSDDFRRRALIEMMDGVLEFRWEDIIKRDIPKPDFMEAKDPENYSKEEIVLAHKYEQQVVELEQERDRYKSFLETTYSKITKTLRETIDKFNGNLQGLFLTRMRVESAILQLDLLRARWYLQALDQMEAFNEAKRTQAVISEQQSKIERIVSSSKILEDELVKLKSQRDVLHNKEKGVKKFKSEFHSLGKIAVELLRKHYKKRPKVVLKNASPGDVLTLAKCITTQSGAVPLLPEFRNYLTSLEALDVQPEDLPESVRPHHWEHLVKIRRHQIDLEMKLKANLMEINEMEKTTVENSAKIGRCKELIAYSGDVLGEMRKNLVEQMKDMEIQLVLKMGQVEIDLKGQRNDTLNAKLIPVGVVKKLNEGILEAGDEKLKALEEMTKFHRGTLLKEWEHKTLQMKTQDLTDELNEINNLLVTKRMREILKKHQLGLPTDGKTVQDLEREIAAMEQIMQKTVNDWWSKIDAVEREIEAKKRENYEFDGKIKEMNIDRWEMELKRNLEAEEKSKEMREGLRRAVLRRARLGRKIQKNYVDLLEMKIESQLLRMRRYPALPGCRVIPMSDADMEEK
ncbi:cilia- and flagella-associated protein 43-like [Diachasma alloeum]|uniref:cilia- and flagella-associated protein 43-like n=1 Tax=Diachasma alloeum TaxID=454923 RepID=UPI0010FB7F36|nr:cilia- and flagella-associated protein 43-like [Diachasma alloeum]